MGNEQHLGQNFNHKEWTQISSSTPNLITLWQNTHNPHIHIEEHTIHTADAEELAHQRQFYFERKNHPFWVAAYYFEEEKSTEMCVSRSVAHIFIEKIPIKIFDLRDLPISDLLHAYSQSLQGYRTLARALGCFRVTAEYIGVNERGIVKVWAGSQWSKVGLVGGKVTQQQMVRSIVQALQSCNQNPATQHIPISIKNFLYRNNDRLTFEMALQELRQFAAEFNHGVIPNRLESLYSAQHLEFLDPLPRSNHNLQQSKHNSHPESTNALLYSTKQRGDQAVGNADSGEMRYTFGMAQEAREVREEERKESKNASFTFFSCFNDNQKMKTSKLLTNQEALNLYTGNPQPSNQLQANPQSNHHPQPQIQQTNPIPVHANPAPTPLLEIKTIQMIPSAPILISAAPYQHYHSFSQPQPQYNYTSYHIPINHPKVHHQPMNQHQPINHANVNHVHTSNTAHHIVHLPANRYPQPNSHNLSYQAHYPQQRRKPPIPQSIIMELYTSQDGFSGDSPLPQLKSLGFVKHTVSEKEQPKNNVRFDSATLIKDGQPTHLTGVPHNERRYSNLQSIQELSLQQWKTDYVLDTSRPNRAPLQPSLVGSQSKREEYQKSRSKSNYSYIVDPNDGKTGDEILRSIRELKGYPNEGR